MPQIGRYPENMTIGQIFEMIKEIRQSTEPLDENLLVQFQLHQLFDKRMSTLDEQLTRLFLTKTKRNKAKSGKHSSQT